MFLRLSRQHPPFGFQVWHECPGPLDRCRRNLLAITDSPAVAVAPAEGSSSPAKGRAALTTTVVAAAAAESTKNTTITGATNLLATAMVSPRSPLLFTSASSEESELAGM